MTSLDLGLIVISNTGIVFNDLFDGYSAFLGLILMFVFEDPLYFSFVFSQKQRGRRHANGRKHTYPGFVYRIDNSRHGRAPWGGGDSTMKTICTDRLTDWSIETTTQRPRMKIA